VAGGAKGKLHQIEILSITNIRFNARLRRNPFCRFGDETCGQTDGHDFVKRSFGHRMHNHVRVKGSLSSYINKKVDDNLILNTIVVYCKIRFYIPGHHLCS
jgi:hypothetical protein